MELTKPVLGISMGDPAGVGPEVVLMAVLNERVQRVCQPLVIGDAGFLHKVSTSLSLPCQVTAVASTQELTAAPGVVPVLDMANVPGDLKLGVVQAAAGRAAVEYIRKGVELALAGETQAIVTAPINKEAVSAAGLPGFTGHTEYIAELTGAQEVAMLLASDAVCISHVTTHVSLRQVSELVTTSRVLRVIELTHGMAQKLGRTAKPMAVAGLNPHAGEHGLFGDEEEAAIVPAIAAARQRGIDVVGPVPPDTVFLRAQRGEFAFVVAMYHDQGHIPAKMLGFETGVNVTLGLPIIRTSVDHGTAFDIAGIGSADPTSLIQATVLAAQLASGTATN